MKRRLIHIFIAVLFVAALFGTALAAGVQQHLVQKGETLSEIAQKYKVPLRSIIQANSIKSAHRIQIGKTLRIPGDTFVKEILYQVKPGDTLIGIARLHNVEWKDLQILNGISSPRSLQSGTEIRIPHDGSFGFRNPLRVPLVLTSKYGYRPHPVTGRYRFHEGIDLRAAVGTRVYASKAGRVIFAGRKGGYGKIVGIEHEGNFSTWYGHLSRIRVKVGQTVSQGRVIGLSGNTGISTGPHLHFEIRYKGRSEKPTKYITIP
ncbi:MAG: M23 family metallopeptidase [Candidatus Poribacteria bacterium]|nr:M23 family metallopeptidase [Candidatus Poribacteria bacterium]